MIKPLYLITLLFLSTAVFAQTSLLFDGVDEYVTSPFPGVTGTNSRTVEARIKTSNAPLQDVIVDWGVFATGQRFTLNILNGLARVEVSGGGLNSISNVADGQWHHLAVTFDNNQPEKYNIYVDGILESTANLSGNTATNTSAGNFTIGRRVDGANNFMGEIDEVRVWNTIRTPSEITTNMNTPLVGNEMGLVAYFSMEGTTNTVGGVIDYSAAGNNGTMINMEATDIISTVPLPVELVSFSATYVADKQMVDLAWETLSETNNRYFAVERSSDGTKWEEVKRIDGSGNSSAKLTYSATDKTPLKGRSYYRLKQTDMDGNFKHSDIHHVYAGDAANNRVALYPNPVDAILTVEGNAADLTELNVYNTVGQLVTSQIRRVSTTENKTVIDISKLQTGIFFIQAGSEMFRVVKR